MLNNISNYKKYFIINIYILQNEKKYKPYKKKK